MKPNDVVAKETLLDSAIYCWMHDQQEACLWGIITLDAPLSDDIIEKVLAISIECVPIISSRLKRGLWGGKWLFVDPGDLRRLIARHTASNKKEAEQLLKEVIRNQIDTDDPPLVRVTSIDTSDEHYLVLQVHHIVMDGEGSKKYFELFAKIYRELEKDPEWRPAYISAMNRSWFQLTKFLKWRYYPLIPVAAFKDFLMVLKLLFRLKNTASIIMGDRPGHTDSIYPENPLFETIGIKGDELDKIKKNNKGINATINDFIMAALMTTVNDWNAAQGQSFSYVATGYTANLRRWWGWPKGIFANMSVICMVMAGKEELVDAHRALRTLKPKFDNAKKEFGLKELFDHVILFIQPEIAGRLVAYAIVRLVKYTHALTNIGIIPDHAGDFGTSKATSYSLLAPPMPSPNIIFTASGFKNSVTIHMNYNPGHMNPETAGAFLRQFKKNLLSLSKGQIKAATG